MLARQSTTMENKYLTDLLNFAANSCATVVLWDTVNDPFCKPGDHHFKRRVALQHALFAHGAQPRRIQYVCKKNYAGDRYDLHQQEEHLSVNFVKSITDAS